MPEDGSFANYLEFDSLVRYRDKRNRSRSKVPVPRPDESEIDYEWWEDAIDEMSEYFSPGASITHLIAGYEYLSEMEPDRAPNEVVATIREVSEARYLDEGIWRLYNSRLYVIPHLRNNGQIDEFVAWFNEKFGFSETLGNEVVRVRYELFSYTEVNI